MSIIASNDPYFQKNPPKQINPRGDHGWTTSINGYQYEALELSRKLIANGRLDPYSHWCTIYIHHDHTPEQVKDIWTKATRTYRRKGISAVWVREISRTNRTHYHLVTRNHSLTTLELKDILKSGLPNLTTNIQVKTYIPKHLVTNSYYFTKGKIKGWVQGRLVKDKHKNKRLLFQPNLGLRKHSTIGNTFWHPQLDTVLAAMKTERETLRRNRQLPGVETAIDNITRLVGPSRSEDYITKFVLLNYHTLDVSYFNDDM